MYRLLKNAGLAALFAALLTRQFFRMKKELEEEMEEQDMRCGDHVLYKKDAPAQPAEEDSSAPQGGGQDAHLL